MNIINATHMEIVKKATLFQGMTEEEIEETLRELHGEVRSYDKGSAILLAGTETDCLGLVLSGSVTIENNDVWGNRTILSHIGPGQFFAESYAFLRDATLMIDVIANEPCRILFLTLHRIRELCDHARPWTVRLLVNLLTISGNKNLTLSGRSFHTAPKTIRGRLMSYLYSVSLKEHSHEFDIPFDRQQLADYLNLERSALSKEIGKMQKEGLLRTRKNHFILLQDMEAV